MREVTVSEIDGIRIGEMTVLVAFLFSETLFSNPKCSVRMNRFFCC